MKQIDRAQKVSAKGASAVCGEDERNDGGQIAHEDMQRLCFGVMDPCDWAVTLSTQLLSASERLREARNDHNNPAKEVTHLSEGEEIAAIRAGVGSFLAELHVMLKSMPMMQSQPNILEALQFILAGVADIDRGAAPRWLAVRATKSHPKRIALEAEWVPLIAALEMLLLDTRITGVDAAAKYIRKRTGRSLGTIKDWHRKLHRRGEHERPQAWAAIRQEVSQIQQALRLLKAEDRPAFIEGRVSDLLT